MVNSYVQATISFSLRW